MNTLSATVSLPIPSDVYIVDITHNVNGSMIACADSKSNVWVSDPILEHIICSSSEPLHTGPLYQLSFDFEHPSLLYSCGSDGWLHLSDLRTFSSISPVRSWSNKENECFSFVPSSQPACLFAGCSEGEIIAFDLHSDRVLTKFDDIHSDDVTKLKISPSERSLFSASLDGLVCTLDLNALPNTDDALLSVLNLEDTVVDFTLYGENHEFLSCITSSNSCSSWRLEDQTCLWRVDQGSPSFLDEYNYLLFPYNDVLEKQLVLVVGSYTGSLGGFTFNSEGCPFPLFSLQNGHSATVRAGTFVNNRLYTAGEDRKMCLWEHSASFSPSVNSISPSQQQQLQSPSFEMNLTRKRIHKKFAPY